MKIDKSNINKLLSSIQKNSIEFTKSQAAIELPVGSSKIGGKPHLPEKFKWPYYKGTNCDGETAKRPLSFIAQIRLSDIEQYDTENLLPHSGFLYFFYELDSMCWGYDPKDKGCARVFYFDLPSDKLKVTDYPETLSGMFRIPEYSLEFKQNNNLPSYEEFMELHDSDIKWDEYDGETAKFGISRDVSSDEIFKLLGYADPVQGAMLKECESVTSGIYCGSAQKLSETQKRKINEGCKEWTLLAQFGTITDEIMFGDCGRIYFYIRRDDLRKCCFDKVHLILQCG